MKEGDFLKKFMRVYRIFVGIIALLALLMVLLIAGVRLIGFTPYTVLSGSMEPTYHVGSVIYVKEATPEKLQINDPITFLLNGTTVTHRIIDIKSGDNGLQFYTKGDANNVADGGFVTPDRIIGVPVFHVPILGYVFNYIQHPPGLYLVAGTVLLLVTLSFLQTGEDAPPEETTEKEPKEPETNSTV